ncbi:MAG: hypothetical protein RLZZ471_1182 [Actinomycetota bacterium]|jgi:hypothetical protein
MSKKANKFSFEVRCQILADVWSEYRDDEEFFGFVDSNDLALPLAYMVSNGIVDLSETAKQMIEESWKALFDIYKDSEFFEYVMENYGDED